MFFSFYGIALFLKLSPQLEKVYIIFISVESLVNPSDSG